MISGLIMNPRLNPLDIRQVFYTMDPYDKSEGPVRAMQKFTVILLTTKGTDALHPWLGTQMSSLPRMNLTQGTELKLFVKDQVNEAISQFFRLQAQERTQNDQTVYDVITDIEFLGVEVKDKNRLAVTVRFTPAARESVIYSLDV